MRFKRRKKPADAQEYAEQIASGVDRREARRGHTAEERKAGEQDSYLQRNWVTRLAVRLFPNKLDWVDVWYWETDEQGEHVAEKVRYPKAEARAHYGDEAQYFKAQESVFIWRMMAASLFAFPPAYAGYVFWFDQNWWAIIGFMLLTPLTFAWGWNLVVPAISMWRFPPIYVVRKDGTPITHHDPAYKEKWSAHNAEFIAATSGKIDEMEADVEAELEEAESAEDAEAIAKAQERMEFLESRRMRLKLLEHKQVDKPAYDSRVLRKMSFRRNVVDAMMLAPEDRVSKPMSFMIGIAVILGALVLGIMFIGNQAGG